MNKRGMTLVEVILALAILGIIAASFVPILSTSYINLMKTKKLTEDLFLAQQAVEQQMEVARNADTSSSDLALTVFGKSVTGHDLDVNVPVAGTAHGEINVFVPKHEVFYNVPEIASASLQAYKSGSLISNPSFLYPLDQTISFSGSKVNGSQVDFLLNVYRWYMSPISLTPPSNYREWIIIKEWNEARTPLSYANSEDFTFIPNIEANYDSLDFARDFGFSDNTIALRFAGRWFVYSVTPYSLIGRIGEEVFSNPVSTNRIMTIDPIYLQYEYVSAGSYNLNTDYSTVMANMMYGMPLAVDVVWDNPVIPITSPSQAEVVRYGTVNGYQDPVEFHFIIKDADPYNDPVATSLTINGADRTTVPTSGSTDYYYSCSILDQYGHLMAGVPVTWSIIGSVTGVSIDTTTSHSSTVRIRVDSSAGGISNTDFTLRVTLDSDGTKYGEKAVHVSKASATTSSVTTVVGNYQVDYTVDIKDSAGNGIDGLTQNDIRINYVYNNSSTYNTLTTVEGYTNVAVTSFTPAGNGHYTWTVYSTSFRYTRSGAGIRIIYSSGNVTFGSYSTRYR